MNMVIEIPSWGGGHRTFPVAVRFWELWQPSWCTKLKIDIETFDQKKIEKNSDSPTRKSGGSKLGEWIFSYNSFGKNTPKSTKINGFWPLPQLPRAVTLRKINIFSPEFFSKCLMISSFDLAHQNGPPRPQKRTGGGNFQYSPLQDPISVSMFI